MSGLGAAADAGAGASPGDGAQRSEPQYTHEFKVEQSYDGDIVYGFDQILIAFELKYINKDTSPWTLKDDMSTYKFLNDFKELKRNIAEYVRVNSHALTAGMEKLVNGIEDIKSDSLGFIKIFNNYCKLRKEIAPQDGVTKGAYEPQVDHHDAQDLSRAFQNQVIEISLIDSPSVYCSKADLTGGGVGCRDISLVRFYTNCEQFKDPIVYQGIIQDERQLAIYRAALRYASFHQSRLFPSATVLPVVKTLLGKRIQEFSINPSDSGLNILVDVSKKQITMSKTLSYFGYIKCKDEVVLTFNADFSKVVRSEATQHYKTNQAMIDTGNACDINDLSFQFSPEVIAFIEGMKTWNPIVSSPADVQVVSQKSDVNAAPADDEKAKRMAEGDDWGEEITLLFNPAPAVPATATSPAVLAASAPAVLAASAPAASAVPAPAPAPATAASVRNPAIGTMIGCASVFGVCAGVTYVALNPKETQRFLSDVVVPMIDHPIVIAAAALILTAMALSATAHYLNKYGREPAHAK